MGILFLPIDIDLTNFNFAQFDKSTKVTSTYKTFWESTEISDNTIVKNNFDAVLQQLPFKKITVLTYKVQQRRVAPHVDVYPDMLLEPNELEHIKEHEPAGYRFVLSGAADSVEVFDGTKWITALSPTVPCCYLLNSTTAIHRVKSDPGRTIIYVRGILDTEKHNALIERSYNKYKDFAISEYVPS